MISNDEIEQKGREFQIRPIDVQKDYVYGWLLKGIFSRPALAQQLVLKGGNALRKGYCPDTRFSKDLDFSARQEITQPVLERELKEVCTFVEAQAGIKFVDAIAIKEKEFGIPDIEALEARLYFKSFFGESDLSLRTQLDITQFDKIYLPIQTRPLLHPYSDAQACSAGIACHKLEEVLASKLLTLLHRRRAQDLFDLVYATVFRNEFGVNRREMVATFLRKSLFERQPEVAKAQLASVPVTEFSGLWTSLIAPAASLFAFDYVVSNFGSLIDSLFALVVPTAAPAFAGAPVGFPPERIMRRGGYTGVPSIGLGYFSASDRNTIISAGRASTMIELEYDGYTRLVEPYKLEYYIRKKDNRGLEYFWGWDTSGGKSGKIGIKQFICDKIQGVRPTARSFRPQFAVEL